MLAEVFKAVLIMSVSGGALTLILLALKPVTERVFGAKWQFYVWISVLIVMICPVKFENQVRLPEPISQGLQTVTVRELPTVSVFEDHSGVYMTEVPSAGQTIDWIEIAAAVWLAVAAVLLLKTVICNILLKKSLDKNSVYCRNFGRAEIRECSEVGAPVLLGCVSPVLYVPEGMADDGKMRYVMAHEGIHLRRNDICIKWLAALVRCVHWFNPLAYIVVRQLNETCEISCDAEAAKGLDADEKKAYMKTILELSQVEITFRKSLSAGLSDDGRCLKKRFSVIQKQEKIGKLSFAAGLLVITALTVCAVGAGGIISGSAAKRDEPLDMVLAYPKYDPEKVDDDKAVKAEAEEPEREAAVDKPLDAAVEPENISDEKTAEVDAVLTEQAVTAEPVPESKTKDIVTESEGEKPQSSDAVTETAAESRPAVPENPAIYGEFNSEGGDTRQVSGVTADENGCITVKIQSNTQEKVDIFLSDAESGKEVQSMGVPVPYEAAYVMDGLEPGKTYDIVLKGTMRNNWNIESEYIIY